MTLALIQGPPTFVLKVVMPLGSPATGLHQATDTARAACKLSQYEGEGFQYPPPVVNVPHSSQDEINSICARKNENGARSTEKDVFSRDRRTSLQVSSGCGLYVPMLLLNNGAFRHAIAQRWNLSRVRAGKQAASIKYYISRKGKGRDAQCNHWSVSYLYLDLKKCSPPLSDLQPVLLWTCCPWKRDIVHLRRHRFFFFLVLGKH